MEGFHLIKMVWVWEKPDLNKIYLFAVGHYKSLIYRYAWGEGPSGNWNIPIFI